MRIGVPKGLLYHNYHVFLEEFLKLLGQEVVVSENTNKKILNSGVKNCIDEACLPIKVFHGHVFSLREKCDLIIIPRIISIEKNEYICPKFCGLPEMVVNTITGLPPVITFPIYANSEHNLYKWCKQVGNYLGKTGFQIKIAFKHAIRQQEKQRLGYNDVNFNFRIALTGHPYNIYDRFINMNIIEKLHSLGVGVLTEEFVDERFIVEENKKLFKKPFWTFAKKAYGFTSYVSNEGIVDGIIYISSFACGIDSVTTELIKGNIKEFPFMVLKIDEQTGEAGLETRIEAFIDMLHIMERRSRINESNISAHG